MNVRAPPLTVRVGGDKWRRALAFYEAATRMPIIDVVVVVVVGGDGGGKSLERMFESEKRWAPSDDARELEIGANAPRRRSRYCVAALAAYEDADFVALLTSS